MPQLIIVVNKEACIKPSARSEVVQEILKRFPYAKVAFEEAACRKSKSS